MQANAFRNVGILHRGKGFDWKDERQIGIAMSLWAWCEDGIVVLIDFYT